MTSNRRAPQDESPTDFPTAELLDEDACYAKLLPILHPDGLSCPRFGSGRLGVHRQHRGTVLDHRCRDCRSGFNAFTGTALRKTNRRSSALVLLLRGFALGVPTARLAREVGCDRMNLLELRHEADECYVNAGEERSAAFPAG